MNTIRFEDYQNLAFSRVHHYANNFNLDWQDITIERSDLISEAYLIFLSTVKKYKELKSAKFSTYYYTRLRKLGDYCTAATRKKTSIIDEDKIGTEDTDFLTMNDTTKYLFKIISKDAKRLLTAILDGDFESKNKVRQTKLNFFKINSIIKKKRKWKGFNTKHAWNEIERNWRLLCR